MRIHSCKTISKLNNSFQPKKFIPCFPQQTKLLTSTIQYNNKWIKRTFSNLNEIEEESGTIKPEKIIPGRPRAVYLDMQSTSPLDPRALDAMLPFLTEAYGNPHSKTHMYGREAMYVVEEARDKVAKLIGAESKEIIFTSGATESNNIAVKGVSRFYKGKKNHVITTATEHKCVLDSCRALEQEGFQVTYLPVKPNGILDLQLLKSALKPETVLVSVMGVNNEIGVVQPLEAIGKICRDNKTFFHTDCAQAVGKIPLDVNKMNIDLMSISGHKVYGPKGIGAIYIRRRPRVRVEPIQSGGGQERGIRSGTLPTFLIVGFGAACDIARKVYLKCFSYYNE